MTLLEVFTACSWRGPLRTRTARQYLANRLNPGCFFRATRFRAGSLLGCRGPLGQLDRRPPGVGDPGARHAAAPRRERLVELHAHALEATAELLQAHHL